jgi:hypothetical protein
MLNEEATLKGGYVRKDRVRLTVRWTNFVEDYVVDFI